jgi:hypothetical protein
MGFNWCEKLLPEARRQFGNPQEGENRPLEAATRQRLVNTQQADICMIPINPINNPNPFYGQSYT